MINWIIYRFIGLIQVIEFHGNITDANLMIPGTQLPQDHFGIELDIGIYLGCC